MKNKHTNQKFFFYFEKEGQIKANDIKIILNILS